MADLSGQFLALYKELAKLMEHGGSEDPRVAALLTRVSELEAEYVSLDASLSNVDSEVASLRSTVQGLSSVDSRLTALAGEVNALKVEIGANADTSSRTGSLWARVKWLLDTVGQNTDAANASGSIFARIKSIVNTIGNANDAGNASGSIFARIKSIVSVIGSTSDAASASGSIYARIKHALANANSAADTANQAITTAQASQIAVNGVVQSVGASTDASSRAGSLWARVKWLLAAVGQSSDASSNSGSLYARSKYLSDELGNDSDAANGALIGTTCAQSPSASVKKWINTFSNTISVRTDNLGSDSLPASSTGTLWQRVKWCIAAINSAGTGPASKGRCAFFTTVDVDGTTGWYVACKKADTSSTRNTVRCQGGLPVWAEVYIDDDGWAGSSGASLMIHLKLIHVQNARTTLSVNTAPDMDAFVLHPHSGRWIVDFLEAYGYKLAGTSRLGVVTRYSGMTEMDANTRACDNIYCFNIDTSLSSHTAALPTWSVLTSQDTYWVFNFDYDNYRSTGSDFSAEVYAYLRIEKI